jgi:acetyl-CoA acetyltransferase family protein
MHGALRAAPAQDLATAVFREALQRAGVAPRDVDEVVLGCAAQPAEAANVARVAALRAGVRVDAPAVTVHRNCASGFEAVTLAADRIRSGEADLVLAGGVESMSRIPLYFRQDSADLFMKLARSKGLLDKLKVALRFRPRHFSPVPALVLGLTDPVSGLNMGQTAEVLAQEFGVSRDEQDAFALESHRRAVEAARAGRLKGEIVPVYPPPDHGSPVVADDGPRPDTSLEALARLRPIFDRRFGTVTAGNSCGVTDGGVAILLASEERARSLGVAPRAYVRSHAYAGCDPKRMGLGPAFATPMALERAGLDLADMDVIEVNEAFAAQVIAVKKAFASREFARRELGRGQAIGEIDDARLNPNGGAIALGHPIAATGARLLLTLSEEMRRRNAAHGLATLCVGGGQGGAVVLDAPEAA